MRAVKKALRALAFLNSNGESTVTQVARAIGVPRTTAYRLLGTLAAEGYVEKQAHSDVYRLKSLVRKLSSGFSDTDLIVEVATPILKRVGVEVGWPLALATPRGADMIVRLTTDYDTPLAIDRYIIGFAVPILHAPAGLCYLAHCDDEGRDFVVNMAPVGVRYDPAYLDNFLAEIRLHGYCHIRFLEYKEAGLAVPLLVGGRAVGGIVMRYIKSTLNAEQIEGIYFPVLQKLARDISVAYEDEINRRTLQINEPVTPAISPMVNRARSA